MLNKKNKNLYIGLSIFIFIIILVIFIIILYSILKKQRYYKCENNKCVECSDCTDYTDSNCDNKCVAPPPPPQQYYKCENQNCIKCDDCKDYLTSNCDNKCVAPPPPPQQYYKCENQNCIKCDDCTDYTDSNCDNKCVAPPPPQPNKFTSILYTYHLYADGKEPDIKNFNAIDIKNKLKAVIDSGYNIINLSFYQYGSIDYVGSFGKFYWLQPSDKQEIVKYAHDKNIKILVSVGGAVGTSSLKNIPYKSVGDDINNIITSMNLDGVDIDVEDPTLFPMISDLTNYLGQKWLNKGILITHAPQSANFGDNTGQPSDYFTVYKNCGYYINFLNIQFYNQGCTHDTYQKIFVPYEYDCWNIAWISTGRDREGTKPLGSVIPLDKIIVGKPIQIGIYGAANGYVDAKTLSSFFQKAKTDISWNTGLMIWEYVPDSDDAKNYLKSILESKYTYSSYDKNDNKNKKIDFINIFIYLLIFILLSIIIYKFTIKNNNVLISSKLYNS